LLMLGAMYHCYHYPVLIRNQQLKLLSPDVSDLSCWLG